MFALSVAEIVEATEPSSFEEAMRSRDWKKWNAGMDEEMESLKKNITWYLSDLYRRARKLLVVDGCIN